MKIKIIDVEVLSSLKNKIYIINIIVIVFVVAFTITLESLYFEINLFKINFFSYSSSIVKFNSSFVSKNDFSFWINFSNRLYWKKEINPLNIIKLAIDKS